MPARMGNTTWRSATVPDDKPLWRFPWPRNRWGEQSPPLWLRHLTSWRFLYWFNNHFNVCWSGVVSWKLGSESDWGLRRGCFFPYDYCGKYDAHERRRMCGLKSLMERPDVFLTFPENHNAD